MGELAKAYYPEGVDIQTLDKDQALALTNEQLKSERAVIFEAAVQVEDFLIRVDILIKNKNSIHLIEVKAKSYDEDEDSFYNKKELKKGKKVIHGDWFEYIADIAFQKQVTQLAFPKTNVTASLMLADKSKVATVDGLNQMFLLTKNQSGQTKAQRVGNSDLGGEILRTVNVDEETNVFLSNPNFLINARVWADLHSKDQKAKTSIGKQCKGCEFQLGELAPANAKSGFQECWNVPQGEVPVTKIWNYKKVDQLIEANKKYFSHLVEDDIEPMPHEERSGLSQTERQWLQIQMVQAGSTAPYVDSKGLSEEMSAWEYPLNFIDFETMTSALPFQKGRRPYEQMAFQFSHHILHADGRVVHASEYIHRGVGSFPNFEFVRELKKALSQNQGTIFKYSHHENTVLLQIHEQLRSSVEVDREELCVWIETITHKKDKAGKKDGNNLTWQGPRDMVDLLDYVKRFYYHPKTQGSNSIKFVLPAIISESKAVQKKFSEWITFDDEGNPKDPYKLLGPLMDGYDNDQIEELFFQGEDIKDGGAASTAYAMMQFTQMSQMERERIIKALLKYCHLDTLAMVMLAVHWIEVSGVRAKVG